MHNVRRKKTTVEAYGSRLQQGHTKYSTSRKIKSTYVYNGEFNGLTFHGQKYTELKTCRHNWFLAYGVFVNVVAVTFAASGKCAPYKFIFSLVNLLFWLESMAIIGY
ncbi:hypothetical protein ACJX0J_026765 [Zea mays]